MNRDWILWRQWGVSCELSSIQAQGARVVSDEGKMRAVYSFIILFGSVGWRHSTQKNVMIGRFSPHRRRSVLDAGLMRIWRQITIVDWQTFALPKAIRTSLKLVSHLWPEIMLASLPAVCVSILARDIRGWFMAPNNPSWLVGWRRICLTLILQRLAAVTWST